jgi:hypothetical protein
LRSHELIALEAEEILARACFGWRGRGLEIEPAFGIAGDQPAE